MNRFNRSKCTRNLLGKLYPNALLCQFSRKESPDCPSVKPGEPLVFWAYATNWGRSKSNRSGGKSAEGSYRFTTCLSQLALMDDWKGNARVVLSLGGPAGISAAEFNAGEFIEAALGRMAETGYETVSYLVRRRRGGTDFRLYFSGCRKKPLRPVRQTGWVRYSLLAGSKINKASNLNINNPLPATRPPAGRPAGLFNLIPDSRTWSRFLAEWIREIHGLAG